MLSEITISPVEAQFSRVEHEVIILFAVWSMIDEMVNYANFEKNSQLKNTNLMFCTSGHKRLFNILLTDFLSLPQSRKGVLPFGLSAPTKSTRPSDRTYLFYLQQIIDSPSFEGSTDPMRAIVRDFRDWLDFECVVQNVWLSEISAEVDVKAKRISLLKICGNMGKHNFSRLQKNVSEIVEILRNSGTEVTEQQAFVALPTFYEWFHDNFFTYHSSTIAEFLNNLRWAIFHYLRSEFERSYEKTHPDDIAYKFTYPEGCKQLLPREMYWSLMNNVRSTPYFPIFTVSNSFKDQY